MEIKKLMNKKPITLRKTDTLKTALAKFTKNKISGCPVVHNKKVVGIITRADIMKAIDIHGNINNADSETFELVLAFLKEKAGIENAKGALKELWEEKVQKHMTKKVIHLTPDDNVYKAAELMNTHNINRLPVVRHQKLAGIVTRADIVNFLAKMQ